MSAISTPPLAIVEENIPNEKKRRRGERTTKIRGVRAGTWVYIGLGVVVVSAIFPYYWSFLIGSGDASTINDPDMSWLPGGNFIANALSVVNDPAVNFWVALWNSIFSSTVIAASVVVFSTLAGWAFAKLRFRGGKWLLAFVVATMAIPMQLGVVPLYILFADLGWTGNIGAVIIPALTSAFGVFWMTQYLSQSVPDELIEAARVDGASMFRTFWTVGVTLRGPAAAMLFLFTFVGAWNQFFWPFIVLDRQSPTLPVALSLLQSNYFVDYSIVLAGVLLATIPLLILFAFAGRQLVSGIMAGAVKGMTIEIQNTALRTASAERPFPQDFLFGAATAAFQIEGAAFEEGRTASIWDAFARVPGAVINADNGDVACDHYHLYRDDVALMKRMGLQTYRFSTSWSRVRPDGGAVNAKGLDFYERLVDELLDADILPWLTLYHWDLPQALQDQGGWAVRSTAEKFTEYALTMHDALGDRVKVWTTLNEPWCSSFLSYTAGIHAPGHYSMEEGMLASHHLLLGHGQTVTELRKRDASLDLGITLNFTVADPADPRNPADVDAARRLDGQHNRWFLDPVFRGAYPADIVEDFRAVDPAATEAFEAAVLPGDLAAISAHIDALGVNYYHGDLVSAAAPDALPTGGDAPTDRRGESPFPAGSGYSNERGLDRTSMHWEVQPEGLTRLLRRVSDEYAAPAGTVLYVTENGAAYDDEVVEVDGETRVPDAERVEFLRGHLGAILDAVDQGVDVRGYFYWSMLDNFEWAWGYEKRFGIVRVDYDTQERTVKDSGLEYARIIEQRALGTDAAAVGR